MSPSKDGSESFHCYMMLTTDSQHATDVAYISPLGPIWSIILDIYAHVLCRRMMPASKPSDDCRKTSFLTLQVTCKASWLSRSCKIGFFVVALYVIYCETSKVLLQHHLNERPHEYQVHHTVYQRLLQIATQFHMFKDPALFVSPESGNTIVAWSSVRWPCFRDMWAYLQRNNLSMYIIHIRRFPFLSVWRLRRVVQISAGTWCTSDYTWSGWWLFVRRCTWCWSWSDLFALQRALLQLSGNDASHSKRALWWIWWGQTNRDIVELPPTT